MSVQHSVLPTSSKLRTVSVLWVKHLEFISGRGSMILSSKSSKLGFHARWIYGKSVVYFRITHRLGRPHYVWDEYLYSVREKVEVRVTASVTVCVGGVIALAYLLLSYLLHPFINHIFGEYNFIELLLCMG